MRPTKQDKTERAIRDRIGAIDWAEVDRQIAYSKMPAGKAEAEKRAVEQRSAKPKPGIKFPELAARMIGTKKPAAKLGHAAVNAMRLRLLDL